MCPAVPSGRGVALPFEPGCDLAGTRTFNRRSWIEAMGERGDGLLDRWARRRVLARWRRATETVGRGDPAQLSRLRQQARSERELLSQFLHQSEAILDGAAAPAQLPGTDWAWRPDLWLGPLPAIACAGAAGGGTALGRGVSLFHDCPAAEVITRQFRSPSAGDPAPYGLRLEVFHFDGSFLSLVLDLPPEAVQGLRTRHLIRLEAVLDLDRPLTVFARLNIKHGPNLEQILREMPLEAGRGVVDFDLFYSELNEKRVEQAWIDLIFQGPAQNQITLRDLTLGRRPRAEL